MSRFLFLALALGITACKKPAPTCGETTGILAPSAMSDNYLEQFELGQKVQKAIVDSCVDDKWPAAGIACMAAERESGRSIGSILSDCAEKIGPAYAALDKQISQLSTEAFAKQLEKARQQAAAEAAAPAAPAP